LRFGVAGVRQRAELGRGGVVVAAPDGIPVAAQLALRLGGERREEKKDR